MILLLVLSLIGAGAGPATGIFSIGQDRPILTAPQELSGAIALSLAYMSTDLISVQVKPSFQTTVCQVDDRYVLDMIIVDQREYTGRIKGIVQVGWYCVMFTCLSLSSESDPSDLRTVLY